MNPHFTSLDWFVLIAYFAGTMSIGFYFWRRSRSPEGFTAAPCSGREAYQRYKGEKSSD